MTMCPISPHQKEIIRQLQEDILQRQGFKAPVADVSNVMGLGSVAKAFPHGVFPQGNIHEFLGASPEHSASCTGFMTAILGKLMQNDAVSIWISTNRMVHPPALKTFGIDPDKIIFINVKKEKELLWVFEEALKCEGLAVVVGEVTTINFAQSRRLQLAVESSKVTGFILRNQAQNLSATTCVARWEVRSLQSQTADELPGIGFPRWHINLLKVRNGNPGSFEVEWRANQFAVIEETASSVNLTTPVNLRTG